MMPTGTVKFYDGLKGFGFILPDDGSKNIFVHERVVEKAGLIDQMTPGRHLRFDIVPDNKSVQAQNLKLITDE